MLAQNVLLLLISTKCTQGHVFNDILLFEPEVFFIFWAIRCIFIGFLKQRSYSPFFQQEFFSINCLYSWPDIMRKRIHLAVSPWNKDLFIHELICLEFSFSLHYSYVVKPVLAVSQRPFVFLARNKNPSEVSLVEAQKLKTKCELMLLLQYNQELHNCFLVELEN